MGMTWLFKHQDFCKCLVLNYADMINIQQLDVVAPHIEAQPQVVENINTGS